MWFDFLLFLVFLYIAISFIEWNIHYYIMHFNEPVKPVLEYLKIDKGNINHHKDTKLDQSLQHDYKEGSLVFNFTDVRIYFVLFFIVLLGFLFWRYFPGFKKYSLTYILIFVSFVYFLYFYIWNSFHTHYHKKYVENDYIPVKNFIPDEENGLYKYLLWYHTLHHLNKGDCKCNYNIVCPLFDFIFGTYKSKVNNTRYFSNHIPQNFREQWLKNHLVFEIRVVNNSIEYKDLDTWKPMPSI